ncbi:MAG: hypothetical protein Q8N36_02255, partial [bacterium]|nr:hypothetical protein [bacterium]
SYVSFLRLLLLAWYSPQSVSKLGYEQELLESMRALGGQIGDKLTNMIDLAITTEADMRYGGYPRLHLELLLVKQAKLISVNSAFQFTERAPVALSVKEAVIHQVIVKEKPLEAGKEAVTVTSGETNMTEPPLSITMIIKAWPEVISAIKSKAPMTGATLGAVEPIKVEGDQVILRMTENNVHTYKRLSANSELEAISEGLRAVLGKKVKIKLVMPQVETADVRPQEIEDIVSLALDLFEGTVIKK